MQTARAKTLNTHKERVQCSAAGGDRKRPPGAACSAFQAPHMLCTQIMHGCYDGCTAGAE
jgi:hypothetical protein